MPEEVGGSDSHVGWMNERELCVYLQIFYSIPWLLHQ